VLHSSKLRFIESEWRFKNGSFIYHASLTLQWTPLLLVISIFACENTHSVATTIFALYSLTETNCYANYSIV